MTGPEVTVAMKAEDVPAGLVERAMREYLPGLYDTGAEAMRHALAAVLPEVRAQVWDEAVEVALTVRPEMGLHINVSEYRQGKVDGLDIAVANMRAARARLTTTTEGPTP